MSVPMPDHITVRPHRYSLRADENALNAVRLEKRQAVITGCLDPQTGAIVLSEKVGLSYQRDTVLHEVLHAVSEHSGLRYALQDRTTPMPEEELMQHLDTGLLGVLRDNPALVAWLCAPDEEPA